MSMVKMTCRFCKRSDTVHVSDKEAKEIKDGVQAICPCCAEDPKLWAEWEAVAAGYEMGHADVAVLN